jgi:hypothetical protein
MKENVNLVDKIDNEETAFNNLKWVFWLIVFCLIGFCFFVSAIITFIVHKGSNSFLMLSAICFGLSYVFSNAIFYMCWQFLKYFNRPKITRLMKIFILIPIVNFSLIGFIIYLWRIKAREEKRILKGEK